MIVPEDGGFGSQTITIRIYDFVITSGKTSIFEDSSINTTNRIVPSFTAMFAMRRIRTRSVVSKGTPGTFEIAKTVVGSSSGGTNGIQRSPSTIASSTRSFIGYYSSVTSSFARVVVGDSICTTDWLDHQWTFFASNFTSSIVGFLDQVAFSMTIIPISFSISSTDRRVILLYTFTFLLFGIVDESQEQS